MRIVIISDLVIVGIAKGITSVTVNSINGTWKINIVSAITLETKKGSTRQQEEVMEIQDKTRRCTRTMDEKV